MKNSTNIYRPEKISSCKQVKLLVVLVCGLAGASIVQAQASADFRGLGGRDPFRRATTRSVRPRKVVPKNVPMPVPPPPIQARIDRYKAQKMAAINAQMAAPKATTALLINEIQVIGIFRTPRGYAAMIEATPIKLSYVVYPGEMFYDGQLVAIEDSRLFFRRETLWTNKEVKTSTETKPLRQANGISDSLAATRSSGDEKSKQAEAGSPKDAIPPKE